MPNVVVTKHNMLGLACEIPVSCPKPCVVGGGERFTPHRAAHQQRWWRGSGCKQYWCWPDCDEMLLGNELIIQKSWLSKAEIPYLSLLIGYTVFIFIKWTSVTLFDEKLSQSNGVLYHPKNIAECKCVAQINIFYYVSIFCPCRFFLFYYMYFQSCVGKKPGKMMRESVFVIFRWSALNGWIAGRGSLPAWIRSTRGVSLLWGLCEALWGGLLVSGCTLPIGCFCLTKTQWDSGLLKDAVSLSCSLQEIICLMLITS